MERPSYKIDSSNPGSDLASEVAAAFTASYMVFKDIGIKYSKRLNCLKYTTDCISFNKYTQWVVPLIRDRWIPISREFEPHQRHPLFP